MSEVVFKGWHQRLGCLVFENGHARISLGVDGGQVNRLVDAAALRSHALMLLAAAMTLEDVEAEGGEES